VVRQERPDVRGRAGTVGAMPDAPTPLKPGDKAPAFSLLDQHGDTVKLSSLKGRKVLVYFYPKADTPGCTVQACGVRDHRADYEKAGAVVLGVSPDPVKKIAKFDEKFGLRFPLLADEDHAVAEAYGVWVEKSMYGRTYMGVERATFLIDAEGHIARSWRKVKVAGHAEEVLAAAKTMTSVRPK